MLTSREKVVKNTSYFIGILLAILTLVSALRAMALNDNSAPLKNNKVLAGLVIRSGDIIDAIQPIYRNINESGELGKPFEGKKVGGEGGGIIKLYKDNYVIVGIKYYKGYWMGSRRIAGFNPFFRKWENGKLVGDAIEVGSWGLVDKVAGKKLFEYLPIQERYMSDLKVLETDLSNRGFKQDGMYISALEPVFGGNDLSVSVRKSDSPELFKVAITPTKKVKPAIATHFDGNDSYYLIKIDIISGSKEGQKANGILSLPENATDGAQYANRFSFHYDGECYSIEQTGAPKVTLNGDALSFLQVVAGPQHHRFGINGGFNRLQFVRYSEKFIKDGGEYFGYLNPYTIVDGAGTVTYEPIVDNVEDVYTNLSCGSTN